MSTYHPSSAEFCRFFDHLISFIYMIVHVTLCIFPLLLKQTKFTDTLPETNIAHENHHFSWEIPSKFGIFMGYVSLPEGIPSSKKGHVFCFQQTVNENMKLPPPPRGL